MKKIKKDELNFLIREFALAQSGVFDFEVLFGYVAQKLKGFDDEDLLFDLACESDWLFEDEREILDNRFMPRHICFKGAEFRVTPLSEEVEGGFVVPGHRFFSYLSRDVFPPDAALKLPDGSSAPTRTVQMPYALAERFLVFMGEFGSIDYLISDHESNADQLIPPYECDVEMTVFDLKAFFEQCGFAPGDSLMLKVEDWVQGHFSVRHVAATQGPINFSEAREWTAALQVGLEDALLDSELGWDCYEQMARMLWLAECNEDAPSVLSDPPLSLATFFNSQSDITLKKVGQTTLFWPKDEPVGSLLANVEDMDRFEADSELDAFFALLGLSVDSGDAEAYMRHALSCGETDPLEVLNRVLSGRCIEFSSESELREFERLWQELWGETRAEYVPEKDPYRELRSDFLELNDRCLTVLRELDDRCPDSMEVMNHPATLKLGEISALINGVLSVCNQNDGGMDESPIPLDEMVQGMSMAIEQISQEFQEIPAGVVPADPARCSVYQLKISLQYAKPPIWRRVLVSGGMVLEELHDVIQAAFGWQECHLHQFIDGRTFYQPSGAGDSFFQMDVEDSTGVLLQDLLRKEKDKIVYEYDFGDSWRHQILLEKVLPPDPGQTLPVCIKGKRACPPEDCGGMFGYYSMLETLDGPDCEEKDHLLEWLEEPIDPEAFDLDEINDRLKW